MPKIKSPCSKDCEGRSATCHAECLAYKEYKKMMDEQKEMIEKSKRTVRDFTGFVVDGVCKYKKRERRQI